MNRAKEVSVAPLSWQRPQPAPGLEHIRPNESPKVEQFTQTLTASEEGPIHLPDDAWAETRESMLNIHKKNDDLGSAVDDLPSKIVNLIESQDASTQGKADGDTDDGVTETVDLLDLDDGRHVSSTPESHAAPFDILQRRST